MKKISTYFAGFAAVMLLTVGCASTKVLTSWSLSGDNNQSMKKVLVIGMMGGKFTGAQYQFENDAVAALQESGVAAISSMAQYGPATFNGMTQEDIFKKITSEGVTSVLFISLLDREKQLNWNPGTVWVGGPSRFAYSRSWSWHFAYGSHMIYTPGYYSIDTNYILDARLYSLVDNDKLIYSAQTSTINPSNVSRLSSSFTRSIIRDMQANGLVPRQR